MLQRGRSDFLARVLSIILLFTAVFEFFAGNYLTGLIALTFAILFFTMKFAVVGLSSIFGGAIILSYYGMIGGWALMYVLKMFRGDFGFAENLHEENSPEALSSLTNQTQGIFDAFASSAVLSASCMILFLLIAIIVVAGGVKKGIERMAKVLMPILFLLLLAVIIRGLTLPGAAKGVEFFLKPDFSKLTTGGVLEALGHVFFSLSLGMAITITYGSYLSSKQNLFKASFYVILLDSAASIMAGLAIFPAVFAMGFSPASGPGLIFKVIPATFGSFPGNVGWLWGGVFFVMLSIAALTSAIALLEICVAFLMDEFKCKRRWATWFTGVILMVLGLLSCVSFSNWDRLMWLRNSLSSGMSQESLKGSFFGLLDYVCSNWMLPLNGLLVAVFVGWVWGTRRAARELRVGASKMSDANLISLCAGMRGDRFYGDKGNRGLTLISLWSILIRFAVPVVIMLVFLRSIGLSLGID